MARQLLSRRPSSSPSSVSTHHQRESPSSSSATLGPRNSNRLRSQTLLARLFRRTEPSFLASQLQTERSHYGEEEESKGRVVSPMRTLMRSLSLQCGPNKAKKERTPVLMEGELTVLVPQQYGRSLSFYFVLEQTRDSDAKIRFTLRQFRLPPESTRRGCLVATVTLSPNDVVTDVQSCRHVRYVLELQLALRMEHAGANVGAECDAGIGAPTLRLAARDERTHIKWFQTFTSCIDKLLAQSEARPWRREGDKGTEAAKIVPMGGDDDPRPSGLLMRDCDRHGIAVRYTSMERSNNGAENDLPAEEIRAARQDRVGEEDEEETKAGVQGTHATERVALDGRNFEYLAPSVTDDCCSPEYRSHESSISHATNNNARNEEESNNQEENDEDAMASHVATQSLVTPYKSAVLAGQKDSNQRMGPNHEYTQATSISLVGAENRRGRPRRAAVGASSRSSLVPPVRSHTHSFSSNGQVFTLDMRYQLVKPIGNGAYGAVIAVKDVVTGGDNLAIKKISNIFEDLIDAKRILREVRLLRHFCHKNITRLHDLAPPPSRAQFDDMYIITELMETDLHQVIYSMQPMSDDHVKYFLYQMLCALDHIHSAGVLHRDMKPSNILLNANCDLKVCDFGLARGGVGTVSTVSAERQQLGELTEYVVTRWYRAPEIMLNCLHYTTAIDVWAVGCIFAEMLLREPLFPGNDYLHQLKLIVKCLGTPKQEDIGFVKNTQALRFLTKLAISKPTKWRDVFASSAAHNDVSAEAMDLLSKMLLFNPEKRISVTAALRHPYLATFFDANDLVVSKPFNFSFDLPDDQLSKATLINLLYEDIEQFHPHVPASVTAASRSFRMGMTASAS